MGTTTLKPAAVLAPRRILLGLLLAITTLGPVASLSPPRLAITSGPPLAIPLLFRRWRRGAKGGADPDAAAATAAAAAATAERVGELEAAVEALTARVVTLEGGFLESPFSLPKGEADGGEPGASSRGPALANRTADEVWAQYEGAASKRARAEALCAWLRIKTEGNTVRHDGTGDSDEFRALWQQYSGEAVALFRELLKDDPDDPGLLSDFVESFSYQSSGKGIAKAALTGDAAVFVRRGGAVDLLTRNHPEYCDGVAYIFSIAFYLAAPVSTPTLHRRRRRRRRRHGHH